MVDPNVQDRISVLAERANEGLLTEAERAEYEAIINAAEVGRTPSSAPEPRLRLP